MSEKDKEEGNGEGEDEVLGASLKDEFRDEVEEVFGIFDKDNDDRVGLLDLGQLLRWLGFNPTERELRNFLDKYDTAKTGLIHKKYVYKIVEQKVKEPDTIEELIEAMKILDHNKDGTIAVPELRWAMTNLGDRMDEPSVDDMIKEIDSDNKGFVLVEEFAKISFNIKEKKGKD